MPVKSAKQFRAMQAAAHGNSEFGIPQGVAKEFLSKTSENKKSKFAKAYKKNKR
jgi:hypothetical protein